MKNLNCKNCGAPMQADASAMTAVCHYCGTEYVLNHRDTDYFRSFYRQMGLFFAADKSGQERRRRADALWRQADERIFACADGSEISVKYLHSFTVDNTEVLFARRSIVFHFLEDGARRADAFRRSVSLLDYPSADTRELSSFFPRVSGGFALSDGTFLLVAAKDDDEYPLCLFGSLSGRHVAWIISRMENLCCVLEYSSLAHPAIGIDTLCINPYTHQASLYGGWWRTGKCNTVGSDGKVLTSAQNLKGLRDTAARLLGYPCAGSVKADKDIPRALADFINSAPKSNAYDDFAFWDDMLIKAYGERRFVTLEADDASVYGS